MTAARLLISRAKSGLNGYLFFWNANDLGRDPEAMWELTAGEMSPGSAQGLDATARSTGSDISYGLRNATKTRERRRAGWLVTTRLRPVRKVKWRRW